MIQEELVHKVQTMIVHDEENLKITAMQIPELLQQRSPELLFDRNLQQIVVAFAIVEQLTEEEYNPDELLKTLCKLYEQLQTIQCLSESERCNVFEQLNIEQRRFERILIQRRIIMVTNNA